MQPQESNAWDRINPSTIWRLLPRWNDIPELFKQDGNRWTQLADEWYAATLNLDSLQTKPGIDREMAIRHIKTILGAWDPQMAHKIASVAYLASQWFEERENEIQN